MMLLSGISRSSRPRLEIDDHGRRRQGVCSLRRRVIHEVTGTTLGDGDRGGLPDAHAAVSTGSTFALVVATRAGSGFGCK